MDWFGNLIGFLIIYWVFKFIWNLFKSEPSSQPPPRRDPSPQPPPRRDPSPWGEPSPTRRVPKKIPSNVLKVRKASVRLGVAIAFADGVFHRKEGLTIQLWMKKQVNSAHQDYRHVLKSELNTEISNSLRDGQKGLINIESVCKSIARLRCKNEKRDLIKLCFEVMDADGKADPSELAQIDLIAKYIKFSRTELFLIKKSRDAQPRKRSAPDPIPRPKRSPSPKRSDNLEKELGFNKNWSKKDQNEFFHREFAKYNHLSTMGNPGQRKHADDFLNKLAILRKKYK